MLAKAKLKKLVFNFFLEEYEDAEAADIQSEKISNKIIELVSTLQEITENSDTAETSRLAHTLKHLLLYADLDDVSDMCGELEIQARKDYINIPLKEKIIQEIVK